MSRHRRPGFYTRLSRWLPHSSYGFKLGLIAVLGLHIPVGVALAAVLGIPAVWPGALAWSIIVGGAAGSVLTVWALRRLLEPIGLLDEQIGAYFARNPPLPNGPPPPTAASDELGRILAGTEYALHHLAILQDQSLYDSLTGLPNRGMLQRYLRQAMEQTRNNDRPLAMLMLDIDAFTDLNNTVGLPNGDLLLQTVARRLQAGTREPNHIARIGNDEFAIIFPNIIFLDEVITWTEAILAAVAQPIAVDGHELHITCSVGITLYPADADSTEALLRNANVAVKLAKQQDRNTYQFYSAALNERLRQRMALERDLHRALERNEFEVYYQPQIDLRDGRVAGVEALVRWRHPSRGLVSPGDFIPLTETTGLIVALGEWVLRTACAQSKSWQLAGLPPLLMSVNLSVRQLTHADIVGTIRRILDDYQLSASFLQVEVTESMVMENLPAVRLVLQQLRSLGVSIALDDFGIGYSSLNYLTTFPINAVKMDRSFIHSFGVDLGTTAISRAILALAQSLALEVIAEGVERTDQLEQLKRHGCDKVQGNFFSRALPADEFVAFLEDRLKAVEQEEL